MYLKATYPKFYLFLILFRFQSSVVFFQPETEETAYVYNYKTTSQYFRILGKSCALFLQPETEDRNNKSRSRPFHLPDTPRSNRNSSSGIILPGTEMTSPDSASSGVLPGGQWRESYCLFALGSWREREEA